MQSFRQVVRATARTTAQAAVASVVTYGAMVWIGGGKETSWAVISALYVVQPSIGGTLSNAVARLVGTLLGTSIGLAGLYLVGHSTIGIAVSLVASALILTTASGYHPGLRFGLIPAAVVILASGGDVVDSAWPRAGAIALGALVGAVASVLVFPRSAHQEVREQLVGAIGDCATLVSAAVASALGEGGQDTDQIDARIRSELVQAAQMHGQSLRRNIRHRPGPQGLPLDEMREAVRRLWHTILILRRTNARILPADIRRTVQTPLREFGTAAHDTLNRYGDAVRKGKPAPPAPRLDDFTEALRNAAFDAARTDIGREEREALFTLAFTARQITTIIGDIRRLSEEARG